MSKLRWGSTYIENDVIGGSSKKLEETHRDVVANIPNAPTVRTFRDWIGYGHRLCALAASGSSSHLCCHGRHSCHDACRDNILSCTHLRERCPYCVFTSPLGPGPSSIIQPSYTRSWYVTLFLCVCAISPWPFSDAFGCKHHSAHYPFAHCNGTSHTHINMQYLPQNIP